MNVLLDEDILKNENYFSTSKLDTAYTFKCVFNNQWLADSTYTHTLKCLQHNLFEQCCFHISRTL